MEISFGVAMFKRSDLYGLVGMGKLNVGQMYVHVKTYHYL